MLTMGSTTRHRVRDGDGSNDGAITGAITITLFAKVGCRKLLTIRPDK